MVKAALAGDRIVGIVMLKDEADAFEEFAAIHEVGCAGRIIHDQELPDGRFNILVQGVSRVRLTDELFSGTSYRRFKAEALPAPSDKALAHASGELARMQSCVLSLRSSVAKTDAQLAEVLRVTSDPLALADILCAVLVSEPDQRQTCLETSNVRDKLSMLNDTLMETMLRLGEPPKPLKMN